MKLSQQFAHVLRLNNTTRRETKPVQHTSIYGKPTTSRYGGGRGQVGIASNPSPPDFRSSRTKAEHRPRRHGR